MSTAPPIPTRDGYDRWSEVYDDDANPLIGLEEPIFDGIVGDVRGLDVIDVGCGTGRHAVRLAQRGAAVTAVDFSGGMLEKARAKPGAESIRFVEHDITTRLPFEDGSFDLVVNALVLDHIHDLDSFFAELGRVCRGGGRVVCTSMHPAMMLKGVQARFSDPETGEKVHVESAPNLVSDYVRSALGAGLAIEHIAEHAADGALAARFPRAEPYLGWPLLFVMAMRRGT